MPAYQYTSEKKHQEHLAWRRAYYAKNKETIQAQNAASLKKRKEADPEKYRKLAEAARLRSKDKPKKKKDQVLDIQTNPMIRDIAKAIAEEKEN